MSASTHSLLLWGQAMWQELPDAEALSTLDDLLVDDYTHTERMTELEGSLGA